MQFHSRNLHQSPQMLDRLGHQTAGTEFTPQTPLWNYTLHHRVQHPTNVPWFKGLLKMESVMQEQLVFIPAPEWSCTNWLYGLHWRALIFASLTGFMLWQGRSNHMTPESYLIEKTKIGDWGPFKQSVRCNKTKVIYAHEFCICDHQWKREFRNRFEHWR